MINIIMAIKKMTDVMYIVRVVAVYSESVPPYIHAEKVIPTHTNVICREHLIQMKIE